MWVKSVLREPHVPDENAVAHLGIPVLVGIEEVVLTINGEALPWQLVAVLAVMTYLKLGACLVSLPGIGKEDQGKLPIGQLTDLSGPLQRRDAIHDDVLALFAHNDAKLAKKISPCKRPAAPCCRHISENRKACTSLPLPSGACTIP